MSYIIEALEEDTPGRGTYRCEICGRQAEFVTGREVEFDITVNDHKFNMFDNIGMLGPESYVCSEACFTMLEISLVGSSEREKISTISGKRYDE